MLTIVLSAIALQQPVTLEEIDKKVAKFPGVIVKAEMISPSVVPMQFKFAPGGWLVATYPTSVQYNHGDKVTTWMPDRREYATAKTDYPNPLPAGFSALWPGPISIVQTGPTTNAKFEKKDCFVLPCKTTDGQELQLFVDRGTLLPYGTRAVANKTTYEMVYRSIEVRKIPMSELEFVPPIDARVAKPGPPVVNLIKTGSKLSSFTALDNFGKKHTLTSLLKNRKGLVLNFWFSSCTGCVAEMPYLVKLHPQLAKQGIGMVGVNAVDAPSIVGRSAKKNSLPYPTLVGNGSKVLTKTTGVLGYPVTMIVDRNQKVVDAFTGFDAERLTKAVEILKN
jgi:peroxiredoxin